MGCLPYKINCFRTTCKSTLEPLIFGAFRDTICGGFCTGRAATRSLSLLPAANDNQWTVIHITSPILEVWQHARVRGSCLKRTTIMKMITPVLALSLFVLTVLAWILEPAFALPPGIWVPADPLPPPPV